MSAAKKKRRGPIRRWVKGLDILPSTVLVLAVLLLGAAVLWVLTTRLLRYA